MVGLASRFFFTAAAARRHLVPLARSRRCSYASLSCPFTFPVCAYLIPEGGGDGVPGEEVEGASVCFGDGFGAGIVE